VTDAPGFVDEDPEEALLADLPFHLDNLQALGSGNALCSLANLLQIHLAPKRQSGQAPENSECHFLPAPHPVIPANKKVGSRPLNRATGFKPKEYSLRGWEKQER
jgi:hypothetical protein